MVGEKKYRFAGSTVMHDGHKLYRIRAIRDFGIVKTGTLGGWIESEANLAHDNDAWVADHAAVYENAVIRDSAIVAGCAVVCGNAVVHDNAVVSDRVRISENADIGGNVHIFGRSHICNNAYIRNAGDIIVVQGGHHLFSTYNFYRCSDGMVRVTSADSCGTLDELKENAENNCDENADELLALANFIQTHFKNR